MRHYAWPESMLSFGNEFRFGGPSVVVKPFRAIREVCSNRNKITTRLIISCRIFPGLAAFGRFALGVVQIRPLILN
jgi:hypothetical protein